MLGAPDCTQSPNIGGNLGITAGIHSVMDCMQSPNIGANLGIITAMHSVVDYTQLPNILVVTSDYMQSIAECIFK